MVQDGTCRIRILLVGLSSLKADGLITCSWLRSVQGGFMPEGRLGKL